MRFLPILVALFSLLHFVPPENFQVSCQTEVPFLANTVDIYNYLLTCPSHWAVTSQNESVFWYAVDATTIRNDKTSAMISDPMCLNEDKFPVRRICTSYGVNPDQPPDCAYTQSLPVDLSPCPEPFEQISSYGGGYVCILISSAKKWESDCVQWGVSESVLHLDDRDFRAIRQHLEERDEKKFWLPLRSYGRFLPFLWHLPGGDSFGYVFDEDKFNKWRLEGERLPDGNCLALSRDGNFRRIHIENCTKEYPTVCIYNEKDPYLKLACPENSVTTRYHGEQDQCLQISDFTGNCQRFFQTDTKNKITFYQNAFKKIFKEYLRGDFLPYPLQDEFACAASIPGLDPYTSKWDYQMWLNVKDKIDNAFWSPNMHSYLKDFKDRGSISLNSYGQWMIFTKHNCEACVIVVTMFTPELHVVFHQDHQTLELIVYSEEFLWRRDDDDSGITCFTDADSTLLSNVKIKDLVWSDKIKATDIIGQNNNFNREYITKSIYELGIEEDTPGNYWCEALSIPDFKVVRSQPVVAYEEEDGTVYAFRTIMKCDGCKKGFSNKELKELAKDFKKLLKKYEYTKRIEEAKVMRIEDVPEDPSKIEVIFHVLVEMDDLKWHCPKNITRHICGLYEIQKDLERITRRASGQKPFYNITVRHTAFCLPYSTPETDETQWISATVGERSILQRLCLTTNLLPVYRFCIGDFIIGAQWDEEHMPKCQEDDIPEMTQMLFKLDNSDKEATEIIDRMQKITDVDSTDIIPADLYLMGSLTRRIATEATNGTEIGLEEIEKIISVYSHTMEVNETTAKASQILNSTNTLLDMNEKIITNVLVNASISNKTSNGQKAHELLGVIEVKAKNIISYVIDPSVANVTGIALYRTPNDTSDLTDFRPVFLYSHQNAEALLGELDLEIATFVPEELLRRIDEINKTTSVNATAAPKPPLRIVISVIANDRMFQDNRNVSYFRSNGRIVSVTIPGYGPNLPSFLPVIFHATYPIRNETEACGFWNFAPTDRNVYSEWATTGCEFLSSSSDMDPPIVLCGCSHLTNFAFLLTGVFKHDLTPEEYIIQRIHLVALDIITVLGCSLSLAGVVGIWITAMFFKAWREKAGSKVLLQLSVAIALQMLLFLFINAEYVIKDIPDEQKKVICITLGALLQYSVLVVFSWMLITAYLQYLRYVVVFGNPKPPHFTLKSVIVGWIMPTVPVILVLGLDMDSYLPPNFLVEDFHGTNCYPQGDSLYFGVLLPVGLIFTANFGIYIAVIYSITRKMDKSTKKNDTKIQMAQLRLSVLLFFLLGMSWIFGFLVFTEKGGNMIFNYLFCLTATLQGFVLFAYFVIMDPTTRKLWEQFFISLRCGRSEKLT